MDKFWENYIATRPTDSKGAFDAFKQMNQDPRPMALGPRNMYNQGQLVAPSVDGSRPGYSGVYKRQEKPGHAVKWRIRGERGGVKAADWLKERGYETTFTSKTEAEKVNKLFNKAVTETKGDISKANWMKEGKALAEEFNAKVLEDFKNKNMSNTPAWKKFLEGKKLKYAGVDHYKSQRVVVGAMDSGAKKYELADVLIDDATKTLKYTDWMEIQKKLTVSPVINTKSFRKHIDKHNKLNSRAVKVSQAFDYLLNNNVSMEIPKNLPLSLQGDRGSLLRKVIYDLTGVGTKPIVEGLNSNKNYKKYKKLVQFADHSNLWKEAAGKTLKEIMDVADYRIGGNVSWSYGSTKKIAKDANGFIFEWGKRHWNYHMKNKTGDSKIKFYWKNKFDANGNPLEIDWEKVPKNKNSVKSIKPTEVFFRYKNPETGRWGKNNWSMSSLRTDGLKSGLFNEVYDAKNAYDDLLAKPVTNPFNPEGNKIRFGQLMKKTFKEGFEDLSSSPYSHEHAAKGAKYSGVNELPFNNIKIATQRVNGALNALRSMEGKTINKNVTKMILNELSQNVFDPYNKNFVDDISTAGKKLAAGVAEGTIYEPKKTELNIVGEKIIKESKDFTELPPKTQTGLLHVAGIDVRHPEGQLQLRKLITAESLNKFLTSKGIKICSSQKASTGGRIGFQGPVCGAKFASERPEEFIKRIKDYPDAKNIINNADSSAMKKVFKDATHWKGWIGGDIAISGIFTAGALEQGKDPLRAIDEGLLWFLPEKVLNSYKKALTKGMDKKDAVYVTRALDMETAYNEYHSNKTQLENIKKRPELANNRDYLAVMNKLSSNMDNAVDTHDSLIESFGAMEREEDTPYIEGVTANAPTEKQYHSGYNKAMDALFEGKADLAVRTSNVAKKHDLGREYSKWLNDLIVPDIFQKGLPKNYQDYTLGEKSGVWTDFFPVQSTQRGENLKYVPAPWKPITATIGRSAGAYAQTDLPFASKLKKYLANIALSRNKGYLLEPTTRQNLTQEEFDIANMYREGIKRDYAQGGRAGYMGGGIAAIRKPSEIPPLRQGLRSIMINDKDN